MSILMCSADAQQKPMSGSSSRLENDTRFIDDAVREGDDNSVKHPERTDEEDPTPIPPPELEEETVIMKKYGGLLQRKPPLISQDHERAFFDSADWALAKQGPHKQPRGPLEPKLQPSPQPQMRSRRSCYAPLSSSSESSESQDGGNTGSSSDAAQSDEFCESKDGGIKELAPEKEIFEERSLEHEGN